MTKTNGNLKFIDSSSLKVFDSSLWNTQQDFLDITQGGGSISGTNTNTIQTQLLTRVIPWLSKGTMMTGLAVSELPFDLIDAETKEVIDSSTDWKNELGGMENPEDLLFMLASSLCLGKAYLIPEYLSQEIVDLHYIAPHTIIPTITTNGIHGLNRSNNVAQDKTKSGIYWPSDGMNEAPQGYLGEMMYFWLPDRDVEIGPAQTYPAGTALAACGLLQAMDGTIKIMSERGFISPTIMAAKGMANPKDREEASKDWSRFIRGFTNWVAKIVNADTISVQRVGAELGEIAQAYPPLTKQAIENIGTAFGIPAQIFMADMAFASEVDAIIRIWYSTSVFRSIYHCIEKTFNQQLLKRFGVVMKFKPETLAAFQDKKTDPSGAWKTYVDGGADPIGAAKMLGITVPDGLTYEEIFPPKPEPKPVPPQLAPFAGQNNPPAALPEPTTIDEAAAQDEPPAMAMNADTVKALDLWRQIAVRKFKKGQALPIDFKSDALPADVAENIREALTAAKTEDAVIKAFEIRMGAQPVDQIKRALDWLETHERAMA